jgi:hypothetical protein
VLFSWLEITVKDLDITVAELQLGPAEESSQCLYQLQSGVGSRSVPTATTSSLHGLIRPEAIEIEGRLEFSLIETDHLRSVVLEKIIDNLLFGLGLQASNVEGDQFELLPVSFTCEISRLTRIFSLLRSVFFLFSLPSSSTPSVILVFWLDFLLLRRQFNTSLVTLPFGTV